MKTVKFAPEKLQASKQTLSMLLSQANTKEDGFTVDQVRMAVKAIDKIEASEDEIAFEDAEYAYVVDRVKSARFTVASHDAIEFVDAVLSAA